MVTTYDNAGRVTSVTPPTANNAVVYSYPDDLTVKVVNGNGNSTVTRSDIFGRVVETRNYNNLNDQVDPWLRYTYDAADRLLSVDKRYGAGDGSSFALTNMSYDMVGRKLAMTDMDMGSWQYRYDALGNLTSQTDARSCTTTLLYNDGLSRLTKKNYSGACTTTLPVSYGYDSVTNGNKGKGKRTSMSDGSGSTTWFYGDARGRLTREVKSITGSGVYTTQWEYDVADQVIGVTYPDNEYVTFGYLPQMLVNAVNGGAYVQSTQYDAAGRVELRELGSNQIRTDYNYYPWDNQGGRLQWLRSGVPSGGGVNPTLQNFTYNL